MASRSALFLSHYLPNSATFPPNQAPPFSLFLDVFIFHTWPPSFPHFLFFPSIDPSFFSLSLFPWKISLYSLSLFFQPFHELLLQGPCAINSHKSNILRTQWGWWWRQTKRCRRLAIPSPSNPLAADDERQVKSRNGDPAGKSKEHRVLKQQVI